MLFVNLIPRNYDLPYAERNFITPEFRADIQKALECRHSPMLFDSLRFHNRWFARIDYRSCLDLDIQSFLCQIPIFFVTTDQVGEKHSIPLVGREMEITVPVSEVPYDDQDFECIKENLKLFRKRAKNYNILDEEKALDARRLEEEEEENDPCPEEPPVSKLKNVCVHQISDLLGAYQSGYPFKLGRPSLYKPRIFIWLDKIWDYTHRDDIGDPLAEERFYALLAQVVLHELMHALMDVNQDPDYRKNVERSPFNYHTSQLYRLREESLAEALSLVLVREVISESMWDYLLSNTRQNSMPYRLGADYADECLLEKAVNNWMDTKERSNRFGREGRTWNRQLYPLCIDHMDHWERACMISLFRLNKRPYPLCVDEQMDSSERAYMIRLFRLNRRPYPLCVDWCDYVMSGVRLEISQLRLYEEGFWSENVYRYRESLDSTKTILYTAKGLVLQVIRDYMEEHQGITRCELKEAFPANLSADYVTLIDYPESNVFKAKGLHETGRPVYDDCILQCSDGQVAVCDYWSLVSMPNFVEHARMLGFKIKTYSKPW